MTSSVACECGAEEQTSVFQQLAKTIKTKGIMNSDKNTKVIERKVIPDIRRAFTDGGGIL